MTGLKVADLFAELGVHVDTASFARGSKALGALKKGVAAFAAFMGVQWFRGLINQTTELGGHIADLSQKVGVDSVALQELGFAASQSGSSMDALGNALGKLAKLASDAKKGGGEAAETFKALGVRVTEADGSLRPAEALLGDIADKIKSMPDGTEKTALAMRAFGRSGKDLIPLLNEGGEGIAKLRQEFVDLGGVIDAETVSSLEAFGDETDRVRVVWDGLRNQLVTALLPHLREAVKAFLEWYKANRLILRQRFENALKVLVPLLKVVIKLFKAMLVIADATVTFLIHTGQMLVRFWKDFHQLIIAATAAMIVYKSAAIGAAIASAAAFAAPIATIAALLLLAEDLWVWANGGDSLIGRIHKGLVDLFVKAIEFWVDAFKEFLGWLDDKIALLGMKIRRYMPEFMGGMNEIQRRNYDAGARTESEINGYGPDKMFDVVYDPHDPQAYARAARERRERPEAYKNDPQVSQIPINAPISITVNGVTVVDPNELARQLQVKLEGVLRTAKSQLDK